MVTYFTLVANTGNCESKLMQLIAEICRESVWRKKIKVNELGRKKSGQERNCWQRAKHAWLYSDLLHVFKGRTFVSSGFSKEGTLISASTILHCWEVQKQNHSRKFILHTKDFGLMVYHTPAFKFRDLSKKIFKKKEKQTISNLCQNQS